MLFTSNNPVIQLLQSTIRKHGLKIGRFPEPDKARRIKILNHFNIQAVLDVGANVGSYGKELREIGYTGDIFSFEPTSEAYHFLEKRCEVGL